MGAVIGLREDFDGAGLRRLAKATKDAAQSRRLLALAEIYDGGARSDVARIGGIGLQVIRNWVLRFNADGPNGLIDRKAPGKPSKLNDKQRQTLAQIVENGPNPAIHGVVRWRLKDLVQWIWEEFGISLDETTVGRELKALGFRKIWRVPVIMRKTNGRSGFKKLPGRTGGDPRQTSGGHRDRALVAGRSAGRTEEQDRPTLGAVRNPPPRAP